MPSNVNSDKAKIKPDHEEPRYLAVSLQATFIIHVAFLPLFPLSFLRFLPFLQPFLYSVTRFIKINEVHVVKSWEATDDSQARRQKRRELFDDAFTIRPLLTNREDSSATVGNRRESFRKNYGNGTMS